MIPPIVDLAQHWLLVYYGAHLVTFKDGKAKRKDRLYFRTKGIVVHDRILNRRKP